MACGCVVCMKCWGQISRSPKCAKEWGKIGRWRKCKTPKPSPKGF